MTRFVNNIKRHSKRVALIITVFLIIAGIIIVSTAHAEAGVETFDYIKTLTEKQTYSILEVVPDEGNLFNFNDWLNSGSSKGWGPDTFTYSATNETINIKRNGSTNDGATSQDGANMYKIAVEPNTRYVFSYRLTGSENAVSRIFFFQYNTANGGSGEWASKYGETNGTYYAYFDAANSTYTHVINTLSDTNYLQFRFGVKTDVSTQELTISDIKLYAVEDYEFDFSAWKNNKYSPVCKHDDGGKNYAVTDDNSVTVVTGTENSGLGNNLTTDVNNNAKAYNMPVVPGATYTLRYYFEKGENTASKGDFRFYYYNNSYSCIDKYWNNSPDNTDDGYYTYTITVPSDAYYLQIRCGTVAMGTSVTFSDITIKRSESYNLFDFDAWASNTNSFNVACNSNSKVTADRESQTVTVNAAYSSNNEEYTCYTNNKNYYNMILEANTTYKISFDLSVTSSDSAISTARGQFFVFTYDKNMNAAAMSGTTNPHIGMYPTVTSGQTVTQSGTFTTGANAYYAQIRLGATDKNSSSATYSNIKIYKAVSTVSDTDNNSSLGFYAGGSEPFASTIADDMSVLNKTERTAYAEYLKSKLEYNGMIGNNNSTPLKYNSYKTYTEKYPWEDTTGGIEVTLDNTETTTANGYYSKYESGDYTDEYCYNADYEYSLHATTVNGTNKYSSGLKGAGLYCQNIQYFVEMTESQYYAQNSVNPNTYIVNFTFLGENTVEEGTPIYVKNKGDSSVHTFYGYYGETDLNIDAEKVYGDVDNDSNADYGYYTATASQGIWNYYSTHHKYVAVYDGYYPADDDELGYFDKVETDYNYVGEGMGLYKFTYDSSKSSVNVEYGKIYYMPFYDNNEWFKQYVFDMTEDEAKSDSAVKVTVNTVTASELNANPDIMYTSDMIALTSESYCGDYNKFSLDLQSSVVTQLEEYILNNSIPVVVDGNVYSAGEKAVNLNTFANWLLTERTSSGKGTDKNGLSSTVGGVNNNVYVFMKSHTPGTTTSIATKLFDTQITGTYYASSSESGTISTGNAYYYVVDMINTENTKRATKSISEMTQYVSIGTAIRCVINHASSDVANKKTEIKLLEIEPYTDKRDSALTDDVIRNWFGLDSSVTINVTTMAVAEYVGKIEDIVENYDAVYIGSSTENMYTSNGKPDYNDDTMDGMYYTNIGDIYFSVNATYDSGSRADGLLGGFLSYDYFNRDQYFGLESSVSLCATDGYLQGISGSLKYCFNPTVLRSSGNDTTPEKLEELTEAADADIPIILSDDLMMSNFESKTYVVNATKYSNPTPNGTSFNVSLSAQLCLSSTSATVNDSDLPSGIKAVYTWYKAGSSSPLCSDKNYSFTTNENADYYCVVTFAKTTKVETVRSSELNQIKIQSNTVKVAMNPKTYHIHIRKYDKDFWKGYKHYAYIDESPSSIKWMWQSGTTHTGSLVSVNDSWYTFTEYAKLTVEIDGHSYSELSISGSYLSDGKMTGYQDDERDYTLTYNNCDVTVQSRTSDTKYYGTINLKSEINPDSIDNCSYWYEVLNTLTRTKLNVLSATEATQNQTELNRYLNLSQPEIVNVTGYNEYSESNPVSIENNTLTCEFEIENNTDLTPSTTTYTVKLEIDIDGDGIYETDEEVSDVDIYEMTDKGTELVEDNIIHQNSTNVTHRYLMERQLTDDFLGAIPWRLTVTKVGDTTAHNSITHYAYNKPDTAEEITILQILKYDTAVTDSIFEKNDVFGSGTNGLNVLQADKSTTETVKVGDDSYSMRILYLKNNDFNIKIKVVNMNYINAVTAVELNGIENTKTTLNGIEVGNLTAQNAEVQQLISGSLATEYKIDCDMLVCGFGSGYTEYVTAYSSYYIAGFIDSGKPVLYSADATSINNDYCDDDDVLEHKGYYLNKFVRPGVGLDRYGVAYYQSSITKLFYGINGLGFDNMLTVDGTTGRSEKSSVFGDTGFVLYNLGGYTASDMLANNYAVAYQPGSGTVNTTTGEVTNKVTEYRFVQGFTRMTMVRYTMPVFGYVERDDDKVKIGDGDSDYGFMNDIPALTNYRGQTIGSYLKNQKLPTKNMVSKVGNTGSWTEIDISDSAKHYAYEEPDATYTTKITQVNKGQITTYPYDINTETLDEEITIASTHEQYYQLNVNDPEVICWFCLAGDNYDDIRNDCANNYYIYTKDNVTYTGAGLSNTFSTEEAKLFFNTLIVAYQASDTAKPGVSFRNSENTKAQTYTTLKHTSVTVNGEDKDSGSGSIYFKVSNLNTSDTSDFKSISVELYCKDSSGNKKTITTINNVTANQLVTQTIDYATISAYGTAGGNLLSSWLTDNKDSEFTIYAVTNVTLQDDTTVTSAETETNLRKIVLKGLS